MGWLRRRTEQYDYTVPAIPLTPAEVAQLIEALHEEDRLYAIHRPDIGGGGSWSRSKAASLATVAGVAAALGHTVIPFQVRDLGMLNGAHLDRWAPNSRIARDFRLLLTRMHALSGMAQVHGWRAHYDNGFRWLGDPPAVTTSPTGQIIRALTS